MMRIVKLFLLVTGVCSWISGISQDNSAIQKHFDEAYQEMADMLDGRRPLSFKRSVFLVENAYFDDQLDYSEFNDYIDHYKKLALAFSKANKLVNYNFPDSSQEKLNASLFTVFTDTIRNDTGQIVSQPFQYNFQDALGEKEHSHVFVTALLLTKKGNCRSLPYLYKILTEELGTKSYLALAPMHMYIKQRNKNIGWYNVELTSGQYPRDAYLIATGYISRENIVNGLYMDTLSLRESTALCLMDLCMAYRVRMDSLYDVNFRLKCADKALTVKPNLVDALLVKQRSHKILWLRYRNNGNAEQAAYHKKQYDQVNQQLIKLDYRDVPEELFQKWYNSYQEHKSKYDNTEINTSFKTVK